MTDTTSTVSLDEAPEKEQFIVAQLNAKLQPIHREEYFGDPLNAALKELGIGEVTGGGTLQAKSGEIEYCDVEIKVRISDDRTVEAIIRRLDTLGAPRGSLLRVEATQRRLPFGMCEGLAVYLNGTDLPDDVYKECDSNVVYDEFNRLVSGDGRVLSYWQGPTETAFYLYGQSFGAMNAGIAPFIASYPLCQRCRILQIA